MKPRSSFSSWTETRTTRFVGVVPRALVLLALTSSSHAERLVVMSDLNGRYGSASYHPRVAVAVARVIELQPDVVLIAGDMVAGQRQPALAREELEAMWDTFHVTVTDPLERACIPLAVVPGNHDASALEGFELERAVYREQWEHRITRLAPVKGGNQPYYYAFAVGPAFIIALDATVPGALPAEQRRFVDAILRSDATRFSIRVVFAHLPLWPFSRGREHEILRDPELERLLREHEVDSFSSGHHHAFWAGASASPPVHVATSSLSGSTRPLVGARERQPYGFTVIDVSASGDIEISALIEPDFRTALPFAALPERIPRVDEELTRFDLVR